MQHSALVHVWNCVDPSSKWAEDYIYVSAVYSWNSVVCSKDFHLLQHCTQAYFYLAQSLKWKSWHYFLFATSRILHGTRDIVRFEVKRGILGLERRNHDLADNRIWHESLKTRNMSSGLSTLRPDILTLARACCPSHQQIVGRVSLRSVGSPSSALLCEW